MSSGVVFNIQRYSVHDGPGIRVTVFFKGCSLRCWWCHNPESQEVQPECVKQIVKLDEDSYVTEDELIGKVMTVAEVIREIEKEQLFLDESGGGVTFSGGEPFMQPEFLNALLRACRKREIHSAVDTTGYAPPEVFESILDDVDLFLYDLKLMDAALHKEYTGVDNTLIVANLKKLDEIGAVVRIRLPLIKTINDSVENIESTARFLAGLNHINDVDLLVYHDLAGAKYKKLSRVDITDRGYTPEPEIVDRTQQILEQYGLSVHLEQ